MYRTFQQCQQKLDSSEAIDYFLARQICQAMKQDQNHLLFHSIMATSQALRNGHTCLKLDSESLTDAETAFWQNPEENKEGYLFPTTDDWHQQLFEMTLASECNQPLVYEKNRLYIRRYWHFEEELGEAIHALLHKPVTEDNDSVSGQAKQVIEQLFPKLLTDENDKNELDWQKIAVANALIHPFTIIAGGPGTGKTFTVTKILAALQSLSDTTLRIAMVAPTGKAAQRLNESIQKAKSVLMMNNLMSDEVLNRIPDTASTLHRLLGVIPGTHNFRYNEHRKLPFDVVLVDEISMIDLPLMTRLIRAIDEHCQIIMLGDADQLPSVAAGSILADLAPRQLPGYSLDSSQKLCDLTGFDIPVLGASNQDSYLSLDHLTVLQKSHRFDGGGEIGLLAKAVISGHSEQSWNLLKQGKEQIEWIQSNSFSHWIEAMVEQYFVPLFHHKMEQNTSDIQTINDAFQQLNEFRFLAATRLGDQGVIAINDMVEQSLRSKGFITSRNEFYPGRPIMVTENHYNVGLYNGDTGLLWHNEQGKLQAVFPDNDSVRWLSLGRLPKVETVYAMTIHKTQGSEFSHVGLVLPERDSLILSRELLYTGITRASKQLSLWGNWSIWNLGVRRKIERYSGLAERVFK